MSASCPEIVRHFGQTSNEKLVFNESTLFKMSTGCFLTFIYFPNNCKEIIFLPPPFDMAV